MAAGVVLAVLAALAYESGYVLQALAARSVDRVDRPSAGLLGSLARRPVFAAGIALGGAGFGLQVLALRDAPIAVVQPIIALGLIALLAFARFVLGEQAGRRGIAGALLVAGGAAGTLALAPTAEHAAPAIGPYVVGAFGVLALSPVLLRRPPSELLVAATAAADVVVVLAGARIAAAASFVEGAAWALVAAGAGALSVTDEASALQRLPAVRIAPVILAAQAVVPVALASIVAGQELPGGAGAAGLAACLVVLVGGMVLLTSSGAVGVIIAADAPHADQPA